MLNKNYPDFTEKIILWLKQKVNESNTKGAIVGLSGGIDSSVTAVLCKKAFPNNTLGIIMPCLSNPEDKEDALLVANKFNINYEIVNLKSTFHTLIDTLPIKDKNNKMAKANIKARLRMLVLYYYSNLFNYLVVGTSNRSELILGYFTKYGDGGVDIEPLGNLLKTEVKQLAKTLEIPDKIINKPPSAGLWENQKDEKEIGISYKEIDEYIISGKGSAKTKKIVNNLALNNKHKLNPAVIPDF